MEKIRQGKAGDEIITLSCTIPDVLGADLYKTQLLLELENYYYKKIIY